MDLWVEHLEANKKPLLTDRVSKNRWPLVLRFIKGAIHGFIIIPVLCHALFTVLVVCLDKYVYDSLGLPPTIVRPKQK